MTPRRPPSSGFTIIEFMVALALGLLVVAGAASIFSALRTSYLGQDAQIQTQEAQRQAIAMVNTLVQSAGYFVEPTTTTRAQALPATTSKNPDGTTFAAGEALTGTDKGGEGQTPTLNLRFQTASGDGIFNCNGGTNTSGSAQLYTNSLGLSEDGELTCAVNGAAAVVLLDGVSALAFVYGVDTDTTNRPNTPSNVTTYMTAKQVASGSLWTRVLTVRVTLTFSGMAQPWIQVIDLRNWT